MNTDKDTMDMQGILEEAYTNYSLRSNKPITGKININGNNTQARATKVVNGWKVEIFDEINKKFISSDEYISDILLKQHTEEIERFEKHNATMRNSSGAIIR